MDRTVGVIGLGYVGLPVAVAFADRHPHTVGFDTDHTRIDELNAGIDRTREVDTKRLRESGLIATIDPADLEGVDFFIVTVPTPIDDQQRPDLSAIRAASRTVGSALKRGAIVVFESTVYPGVTEDICGPILEETSGLRRGVDFTLGYSPERINPGDHAHRFESIPKVVSGQDAETLSEVARMYRSVIDAEIHQAPSIAVAEASKVIENTQRDLNIALVNELATIFDRLGIDTSAVLDAADTKWNFNRFTPGLVGGHCIGVDPYYLTARAQQVGIQPQVILAGRRINNKMGEFIADKTIKLLVQAGTDMSECRVLVVGIAFKENVPDFRNTGALSIVKHLDEYGIATTVWDPVCDPAAVESAHGINIGDPGDTSAYAAIILAVPHDDVLDDVTTWIREHPPHAVIDVKGALDSSAMPDAVTYWRL
ncbi:MAG: nucleotide sugar dehydrogenase [Actinomycetia bacterium]|nr:nucleotide sugar dehydrogenase [Actinomycetes bacterium]